jgi:hypothetical protein
MTAKEIKKIQEVLRAQTAKKMNGGQIGSMVGAATNLFAPGIGSAITPILTQLGSAIEEGISGNKLQLGQNTNPYGYELGGKLQNSGMGPGMALYKGREHRTGGIMVMPSGVPSPKGEKSNVEDEEVLVQLGKLGNHIFSKKLKIQ